MKVNKNQLNRKVFALNDFRGVDYASSPLEVKPYRATDMANLLLMDGMLHKRKGVRQSFIEHPLSGDGKTFDEEFEVKVFPYNEDYMLVQYLYRDNSKGSVFYIYARGMTDNKWYHVETYTNKNAKSLGQAVQAGGTECIFCGGEYLINYGSWIAPVYGADVYVPTTTINIPARFIVADKTEDGEIKYITKLDGEVAYPNQSNESINMLTGGRKNKCMVKSSLSYGGDTVHFLLDGEPVAYDHYSEQEWPNYRWKEPTVKNQDGQTIWFDGVKSSEILNHGNSMIWASKEYGVAICSSAMLLKLEDVLTSDDEKTHVLAIYDEKKFKTFLEKCSADLNGYIHLEVAYHDKNSENNSKDITSCTSATLFGVDGANDRIFVGGGQKGNMVYFSENDISLKPNPTYFPADQFLVCGMDGAKVNGFMRVSNGTLAIFKDVENYEDVSVYYTSGHYVDVGTGEEGNTYQQARFTVQAGDIARKGISARAIDNYDGDNLFVSKEGVYGIQLSDNVASGERYARERSRTINPKITKHDLRNAKSIVYKDKYYLAVDNGEVYVADARYKFTQQGDQSNTYNYEWFRLTGLYVKAWCIIYDKLCFIDKDGYLCEFTDEYADQYLLDSNRGELTVHNETVVFPQKNLDLINSSAYAVDDGGSTWSITLTDDKKAIKIPYGIDVTNSKPFKLWFYVPVSSYWRSAVLDLNSPINHKNMWSLTLTAMAQGGGQIDIGYKTRLNYVNDIQSEGANSSTWGDDILFGESMVSLLTKEESPFGLYSFDVGGYIGVNSYRRRIFERNFMHIQLLFISESVSDCAVSEIDIEYSIARKNIGVG